MLLTSPFSRITMVLVGLHFFLYGLFGCIGEAQGAVKKNLAEVESVNRKIRVAIIDTGVDFSHKELKHLIWNNEGEKGKDMLKYDKSNNGKDDDANGFVDDFHGWNFIDNNNDVRDHNGHGTHIAGIIAGELKKNSHLEIIPIKALDSSLTGEAAIRASVKAIEYAIAAKADIINYSAGGYDRSPEEERAIKKAKSQGIILVAAAGNNRMNSDRFGFFPAHYALTNVISVAAVDSRGKLLPSSNYGPSTTTLSAYGQNITSTLPHDRYGKLSGTSQAAAQVTRVLAAQMAMRNSSVNPIETMIKSAKKELLLSGRIKNPVIVSDLQRE